jgi:hypothetical protein
VRGARFYNDEIERRMCMRQSPAPLEVVARGFCWNDSSNLVVSSLFTHIICGVEQRRLASLDPTVSSVYGTVNYVGEHKAGRELFMYPFFFFFFFLSSRRNYLLCIFTTERERE